jgi:ABC-type lipoprotein export system ATPase subunit
MGRSGSGKSTLLNILGGLDRDYEGKVFFDGQELKQLNDRQIAQLRNQKIGYIFQSFHLLDQLTCEENVMLPSWFADLSHAAALQRAKDLLTRVGLAHKIGTRPQRLSGGEKQRVAIARALMMEPALLLCDEPTGNLDETTGEEILQLFQRLQKEERLTLILVTHEIRTAEIADQVFVLQQGKLLQGKLEDGHVIPHA